MGANAQTTVPTFVASQVLTADQQNQSARTGVPVFASTGDRDAAFGGTGEKTLAEGQLCYVEGTGLQTYNAGGSWVTWGAAPSTGAFTYITGASFSAAASVSVNNCFTSAYQNYRIIVEGAGSLGGGAFVDWRFRVGGADNSTTNYFYSYNTVDASSTETNVGAGSQTAFRIGNAASLAFGFDITVTSPQLAATHTINTLFSSAGSAIGITGRAGGTFNTATSFDGFSLLPASGTITGTYRVYGLADS